MPHRRALAGVSGARPRVSKPATRKRLAGNNFRYSADMGQMPHALMACCGEASGHDECVDGSGYPRGLLSASLDMPDRVMAAAVSYQSACEPRPYRDALSAKDAAHRLGERGRVEQGIRCVAGDQ